jgi:hypothetical protein
MRGCGRGVLCAVLHLSSAECCVGWERSRSYGRWQGGETGWKSGESCRPFAHSHHVICVEVAILLGLPRFAERCEQKDVSSQQGFIVEEGERKSTSFSAPGGSRGVDGGRRA